MKRTLIRGFLFAGVISVGGLAGACSCGDDGGDGDGDGDGDADAAIDGPEITATRAGTIALTQIAVQDEDATVTGAAINGAAFTVAYDDLTTLGVPPSYTDGDVGCTVFEFDASGGAGTDNEAAEVDEGPVSITNFGDLGNLNCAFVSADIGYQCAPMTGATGTVGAGSSLAPNGDGTVLATINGSDFTAVGGSGARGMTITFPDGTWPTATNDGTFQITEVDPNGDGAQTINILNPTTAAGEVVDTQNDFAITVGNGPIIANANDGPYHIFAGNAGQFSISGGQESGGAIEMFSEDITPSTLDGTDLTLVVREVDAQGNDVDAFLPYALPTTEFSLSCDQGVGGNCNAGSPISALIVSGRTTDGTLPTTGNPIVDNTEMPDPAGTYTTFTCVFLGQKTGTISQAALDAIHAGTPTRIETRVIYAGGLINAEDDGDRVNLLAGYAIIGFTDPPQ
jgi:hypothetical protein